MGPGWAWATTVVVTGLLCLFALFGSGPGEPRRRRLFTELMRAEGSVPISAKSTWPRKGGDIYNTAQCSSCPGVGTQVDPATGKEYYFKWKIAAGTSIPSGIRSIVLGYDKFKQWANDRSSYGSLTTAIGAPTVDRIPEMLNHQPQGDLALYVTSAAGVVYKINRRTGKIVWQFDTQGSIGTGGAAALVSTDANPINYRLSRYDYWLNSYIYYDDNHGAIVVGNSIGKYYALGSQGLVAELVNFGSSGYGLGDSQVTASPLTGANQNSGILICTQPKGTTDHHSLIKKCDTTSCALTGADWKFTVPNTNGGSGFSTTPTIGPDGTIYIGSDKFYALSPQGTLLWSYNDNGAASFKIANTAAIFSTAQSAIFFGAWNSKFYSLRTVPTVISATGTWALGATTVTLSSAIAIPVGSLVSGNGLSTTSASFVTAVSGTTVTLSATTSAAKTTATALQFTTGSKSWSFTAGGAFKSYAALDSNSGSIYTANTDGFLYAISSSTGSMLWKQRYSGATWTAPISLSGDGALYFSNMAIDAGTGAIRWVLSELDGMTGDGNYTHAATAIADDGTVFMGTESGALFAIGPLPVADPDTLFLQDLVAAMQNAFQDWYAEPTSGKPIYAPAMLSDLKNALDFTRLPDGVTYRNPVCSSAADAGEYTIFGRTEGNRNIQITCMNGRLSMLNIGALLVGNGNEQYSGNDLSSFYPRGLSIPISIGGLQGLTSLAITCTPILSIPSSVGKLKQLRRLSLGCDNQVSGGFGDLYSDTDATIPATIGDLSSLTLLQIRGGFAKGDIPSAIGRLVNLQRLDLTRIGQTVSGVPTELGGLQSLTKLQLATSSAYGMSVRSDIRSLCLADTLVAKLGLSNGNLLSDSATGTDLTYLRPFLPPQCALPPWPPTSAPSMVGKGASNKQPTVRPTALPPTHMVTVTTGTSVFYSLHADQKCQFQPFGAFFPTVASSPMKLRQCSAVGSTSTSYVSLACRLGSRKYTIEESVYSTADCSGTPTRKAVFKHDSLCSWDGVNGGFMKIRCGEDNLPAAAAQVKLGTTYESPLCDSPRRSLNVSHWAGVCTPKYIPNLLRGPTIAFNYKLSLKRRDPNGGAHGLLVVESRYDATDVFCERTKTTQKVLSYATTPGGSSQAQCLQDPLASGRYYLTSQSSFPKFSTATPTASPNTPRVGGSLSTTSAGSTPTPTTTASPTPGLFSAEFDFSHYVADTMQCSSLTQHMTNLPFCDKGTLPSPWVVTSATVSGSPVYGQKRTTSATAPYAVVLYHDVMVRSPPMIANMAGTTYTVQFDVAPTAGNAYSTPFPYTRELDFVVLEVIQSDGTVLPGGKFSFYPSSFADPAFVDPQSPGRQVDGSNKVLLANACTSSGCPWHRASFTYVGAGNSTSSVSMRFRCGIQYFLCGAIDKLAVFQSPNTYTVAPTPAPTRVPNKPPPQLLVISNHWLVPSTSCEAGRTRPGINEIQVFNGNKQVTGLKANLGRFSAYSTSTQALWQTRYPADSSSCSSIFPGLLTDGDTAASWYPCSCLSKTQGAVWMDLTNVTFDRVVVWAPSGFSSSWGGARIALVSSPDATPSWQASFPLSTLQSITTARAFSFYPRGGKMRCVKPSGYCVGTVGNSTSKTFSFGSGTTTLTQDCTADLDCVKKYNAEWSNPRKIWTA